MTTKTEMTLENVCFRYDGSQEAVECIQLINKKYEVEFGGVLTQKYWITKDGHPVSTIRKPSSYNLISPSDYLLLLSAPESQAHLLTEKDLIAGNRFECIEDFKTINKKKLFIAKSVYQCNYNGTITDELSRNCALSNPDTLNRHFKLASQEEGEEKYKSKVEEKITSLTSQLVAPTLEQERKMSDNPKLASQPPVMEGKEETLQDVIKRVSPFGTMTISNPKMLIALEDFIGQKTSSLQSEVEQLKGLLRESKIFCGGSLQARIDNYLSK